MKFKQKQIDVEVFTWQTPFPFGAYQGIALCEVPAKWLLLMLESGRLKKHSKTLHRFIARNKKALELEDKINTTIAVNLAYSKLKGE